MYRVLLLLFVVTCSAQFLPNGCPKDFTVYLSLPHETDCDRFYTCSNGHKILMRCAPGTVFDPKLQVCNWPFAVDCDRNEYQSTGAPTEDPLTTESTATSVIVTESASSTQSTKSTASPPTPANQCPSDPAVSLLLPHETDCSKFYLCSNGGKILMSCPSGTLFDFETQMCLWPDQVTCVTKVPTTSTTQATIPSSSSSPPDPVVTTTPTDYETSSQTHATESTSTTNIASASTTQGPNTQNPVVTTEGYTTVPSYSTTPDYATSSQSDYTESTSTTVNSSLPPLTSTTERSTTLEPGVTTEGHTMESYTTVASETTEDLYLTNHPTTDRYDVTTQTVTIDEDVEATAPPAPPALCPDGYFGNIPHPELCNSFYMCAGGIAIQLFCSKGFEYDHEVGHCVLISDSGCTAMKGTSTPHQTTEFDKTTTPLELATDDNSETTPIITTPVQDITLSTTEQSLGSTEPSSTDQIKTTDKTITSDVSTTTEHVETTERLPNTRSTTPEFSETSTEHADTTSEELQTTTNDQMTTTSEFFNTTDETGTTSDYASTTTEQSSLCPDGYFGNIPHPELCDTFYMCVGGIPIQLFCRDGFEYDEKLGRCVPISEGGCMSLKGSTTSQISSSNGYTETTLDGIDATKPYTETEEDHTPTLSTDSPTDIHTESTWMTNWPESTDTTTEKEITTPEDVQSPETTMTTGNGQTSISQSTIEHSTAAITTPTSTSLDPSTDAETIISSGSTVTGTSEVSTVITSAPDTSETSFTTVTHITDYSEDPSTTYVTMSTDRTTVTKAPESTMPEVETTTENAICPPGVFGNVPHPEKCNSFYMCAGGVAIQLYCSNGFEFDPAVGHCVLISDSGCTALKGSTTTQLSSTNDVSTGYSDTTLDGIDTTKPYTETEEDYTSNFSTDSPTDIHTESTWMTNRPESTDTTTEKEITTPEDVQSPETTMTTGNGQTSISQSTIEHSTAAITTPTSTSLDPSTDAETTISSGSTVTGTSEVSTVITSAPDTSETSFTTVTQITDYSEDPSTTYVTMSTDRTTVTKAPESTMPEVETTTENAICPPGVFGNVPHPDKCNSFYMCAGGVAIQLYCSNGFEFDPAVGHCVLISDSGCTALKGSTTTQLSSTNDASTGYSDTTLDGIDTTKPYTETEEDYTSNFSTDSPTDIHTESTWMTNRPESTDTTTEKEITTPEDVQSPETTMTTGNGQTSISQSTIEHSTAAITTPTSTSLDPSTDAETTISSGSTVTGTSEVSTVITSAPDTSETSFTTVTQITDYSEDPSTTYVTMSTDRTTVTKAPESTMPEVETTTENAICPPGVFGNVPHPEKCDSFYMCAGGVAIQLYCSNGFEFDPAIGHCVLISDSGCTALKGSTTTQLSSTNDASTGYSDTTLDGIGTTKPYTETEEDYTPNFNPDSPTDMISESTWMTNKPESTSETTTEKEITTPSDVQSPETTMTSGNVQTTMSESTIEHSTPAITTSTSTTLYPSTKTTSVDAETISSSGSPVTETTEAGTVTTSAADIAETSTQETQTVDYSESSSTTYVTMSSERTTVTNAPETTMPEVETTTEIAICPPGVFGNVPHPEKCDSFYMCAGGVAIQLYCSNGFEFDPAVGHCVLISDSGCTALKGTTTTQKSSTNGASTGYNDTTLDEIDTTKPYTETEEDHTSNFGTDSPTDIISESTWMTNNPESTSETTTEKGITTPKYVQSPETTMTTGSGQTTMTQSTIEHSTPAITTPTSTTLNPSIKTTSVDAETSISSGSTEAGTIEAGTMTTSDVNTAATSDTTVTQTLEYSESQTYTTDVVMSTERSTVTNAPESTTTGIAICPPGVFGNVPHPEKCDSFYMCAGGVAIPLFCSNGFEFDPKLGHCVLISDSGCTALKGSSTTQKISTNDLITTDTTFEETVTTESLEIEEINTTLTYGTGSTKEISESTWMTSSPDSITESATELEITNPNDVKTSPEVTVTSGYEQTTMFLSTTDHTSDVTAETSTIGTPTETTLAQIDINSSTSIDFQTTEVDVVSTSTTTPTFVDSETQTTSDVTVSTDRSTVTDPPGSATVICPPGVFGNVPHPEECDSFYMCAGGIAIPLYCSKGFEFDPTLGNCVLISDSGCTALKGSTTTQNSYNTETTNYTTVTEDVQTTLAATSSTSQQIVTDTSNATVTQTAEDSTIFPTTTQNQKTTGVTSTERPTVTNAPESTTPEVETTTGNAICPPGVFGNVPHPEKCDSFYMCAGGIAIPLYCSNGFEFDPALGNCVLISDDGCTAMKGSTSIPNSSANDITDGHSDTTLDKTDTTKHSTELEEVVTLSTSRTDYTNEVVSESTPSKSTVTQSEDQTTTNATIYTAKSTVTNRPESTTLSLETTTEVAICPPGVFGNVPHPEICDSFYMCAGGTAIPLYCSNGFEFDSAVGQCVAISEEGCTAQQKRTTSGNEVETDDIDTTIDAEDMNTSESPSVVEADSTSTTRVTDEIVETTTEAAVCPPGVFGSVPHPTLCDAFYMCTGNVAIQLYCSSGFEFDPELARCVVISDNGCTAMRT